MSAFRSKRSSYVMFCVTAFVLGLGSASLGCAIDLIGAIKTDQRLSKAKEWVSVSNVLDRFTLNTLDKVTLMLPRNEALAAFEKQFPNVHKKIVESKDNMETLILFGSTDNLILPQDIKKGMYVADDAVVSLLAEYASISPEGKVCISDYTRTIPCDSELMTPCCSTLDMEKIIQTEEGSIYLVSDVLIPQELFDELS